MNISNLIRLNRQLLKMEDPCSFEAISIEQNIIDYYIQKQQICCHDTFVDHGYYRFHNGETYLAEKENSEVRLVECTTCHTYIMLFRTLCDDWDTTYGNMPITILKNEKGYTYHRQGF